MWKTTLTAALTIVLASCSRDQPSPSPTPSETASPATAATAATTTNDGTDSTAPILSPDDANFVDARKGFGWGDRCFTEIKQGKWGWAHAACDRALALPDVDSKARPLLLYNEGLIAKHAGDNVAARNYFAQSLALRAPADPGRATVEKELVSVGGQVQSKTFACGGVRCSGMCCDDGSEKGAHGPTCVTGAIPDWCYENLYSLRGSCDPKTNEPCAGDEKCCRLRFPIAKAANPLCMANPGPDDCAN
jgi:hypothetical protein